MTPRARIALIGIAAASLLACGTYHPPAPLAGPASYAIHAPFDAVWPEIISYFADTKIPIETIDRSSGLIATRRFVLSAASGSAWLDCGTYERGGQEIHYVAGIADFNVFVRSHGDSVAVRVNLTGSSTITDGTQVGTITHACESTGKFEAALMAQLRTAERK